MKTESRILLAVAMAATTMASAGRLYAQQASAGAPLAKEAVLAALTSKVDTKKSKVGDAVTAKTLNPLQLADGTILPAGSKLVGKVTQAQPKSSGTATVAIVFTEVDKKGGSPMPVHGLLAAVAPEPSMADSGGSTNDLPMGHGGSQAQTAAITGTNISTSGGAMQPSIQPGSSVKGVALDPEPSADGSSVLHGEKDFKLGDGTRLEVGLTAAQ